MWLMFPTSSVIFFHWHGLLSLPRSEDLQHEKRIGDNDKQVGHKIIITIKTIGTQGLKLCLCLSRPRNVSRAGTGMETQLSEIKKKCQRPGGAKNCHTMLCRNWPLPFSCFLPCSWLCQFFWNRHYHHHWTDARFFRIPKWRSSTRQTEKMNSSWRNLYDNNMYFFDLLGSTMLCTL